MQNTGSIIVGGALWTTAVIDAYKKFSEDQQLLEPFPAIEPESA